MSRTVIVAAVASLVLAGCQGSPEPSQPPTSEDALTTVSPPTEEAAVTSDAAPTTEEPEPTETAETAAPEMPDEAREQTEAGAEAFVEHYVSAFNYAYQAGDDATLAQLGSSDCRSCEALSGLVSSPSDIVNYLTVRELRPLMHGQAATVEAEIQQAETASSPATSGTAMFELDWTDGAWLVSEITVQADA